MALVYQEWLLVHTPRVKQTAGGKQPYSPELSLGPCDELGGGEGVEGRHMREGHMYTHGWAMRLCRGNQHSIVKQSYSSPKKKTKTDIRFCQMLCLHLLRWLYNFLLIMSIWQIILIYFLMLNQFCIPRINPTYPQCSFLFQYIAELWLLKHWKSLCRFALFLFKIFDR